MQTIIVSACLLGQKVRYDGAEKTIIDADFEWLSQHHNVIAFCPEVAGGLPTPRAAAEISSGTGNDVLNNAALVIDNSGQDVTNAFVVGAQLALEKCQDLQINYAILTERSPSCGSTEIYDGSFNGIKKSGLGVTAALLKQHGITVFNQHQIKQLRSLLEQ